MNIFIFTGGEAPSPETAKPFFEKCKPDYVIAADSGLETLDLYAECKPDLHKAKHQHENLRKKNRKLK